MLDRANRRWLLAAGIAALVSTASPTSRFARAGEAAQQRGGQAWLESQAARLGDPSYAMREQATRRLIDAGIAARPVVERLLANSDAEVRARAERVLRVITEYDFRVRLEAFAADIDGKRNQTLPGWDRFRREMGDGREARAVFAAMQRAEPALWEAFAARDPGLNALYSERCEEIQSLAQPSEGEGVELVVGAIATILFLGGSGEVGVDDENALMTVTLIHYPPFLQAVSDQPAASAEIADRAPGFATGMRAAISRALYRRLLGMWIGRGDAPAVAREKLRLAFNFDLKDAGSSLARSVLAGDGGSLEARPYAILAIGRFGTRADLPLVERYFGDEAVCVKHRFNRRVVQVQVREVALAVAVGMTLQDPKSYGFDRLQPHAQMLYLAGSLALADDGARSKAFQKWAEWKAAQGGAGNAADGEKPAGGEKPTNPQKAAEAQPPAGRQPPPADKPAEE